jgi:hypothetical protein
MLHFVFNSFPIDLVNIVHSYSNVALCQGKFVRQLLADKEKFHKPWSMTQTCTGGVLISSRFSNVIELLEDSKITQIAEIVNPCQITLQNGIIYVADWSSHVRLFSLQGKFLRDIGSNCLHFSCGVAVSSIGEIFVSDFENDRITVFSKDGQLLRQWGATGTDKSNFQYPICIVFHKERLFVVDMYNNRVQVFSSNGDFLFSFGQFGKDIGEFSTPCHLTISAFDEIFVVDRENKRIQIFDMNGEYLRCFYTVSKPLCISITPYGHLLINAYKNIHLYK